MWKVVQLGNGKIIKAGLTDEESARDWLESQSELDEEGFDCQEMEAEEEEEYLEALDDVGIDEDEDFEKALESNLSLGAYSSDEDDQDYDPDDVMLNEFDPDED